MKIKNFFLAVLLVFSGFFVALADEPEVVNPVASKPVPAVAPDTSGNGIQQQLQGFNLNGYNNTGQKTWQVNGDKADITDDNIKVTNVDAKFYGKEKANLTSKTGTIDKVNGKVHLQDDVVITSDRGTKMTTDSLDWNRNQDLVTTDDPVKITDAQGVVTGDGFRAHPNLKQASINSNVKAVMSTNSRNHPTPAGQKVTITCDGSMQMDQLHMHAIFSDNVIAVEDATGRKLYADKMDVWFDDKTKKIKKVLCKGHVKVIQGENVSYSDEMTYTGGDQQLLMTGRPKIVFDTGSTKGDGMFQKLGK